MGNSKPAGGNSMGFDSPSRHHLSYLFAICCRGGKYRKPFLRYKYGTLRIQFIFNTLRFSKCWLGRRHRYIDCPYIRSITESAADKVSALGTKLEGSYGMERTFQASWIQDTGLIAATLLD